MVVFLKDEKAITITSAFLKNVNESNDKPNKNESQKVANFTRDQWNHGCKIKKIYSTDNEEDLLFLNFLES